jgi:hypothetical protein
MALERSLSLPEDRRMKGKERTLQQDIERFGNVLWRGPAIEIAEQSKKLVLKAGGIQDVKFRLEPKHLPFGGKISFEMLLLLSEHMRSRYAHVGLDVVDVAQHIYDAVRKDSFPMPDEPLDVSVPVINHCARSLEIESNAKLFHLFYPPEAAYVHGDELEGIIGNEEDKPVYIRGDEGIDWVIRRDTTPSGKIQATGLFLKIHPTERYWIPPSDDNIRLPGEGNFQEARKYLFENVFIKTDHQDHVMPEGALWIGKSPFMRLSHNYYVKLEHDAYVRTNGDYKRVGMQTHSPLLEGGRTEHNPHVEIKGKADWVRASIIRNGAVAMAG